MWADTTHPNPGLPDQLNYAALVDEGIIVMKDGAFLAGWYYAGPDLDSASEQELAILSAQINAALARLGDGWLLHMDVLRRPSQAYPLGGAFPDPTTATIEAERRADYTTTGEHFESVHAFTLTFRPLPELASRTAAFFFDDDRPARQSVNWQFVKRVFQRDIQDMHDALSLRLPLARMSSAELLTYLHACITGLAHPVQVPQLPMYLDAILGSQDFVGGLQPQIGELHVRPIGLTGFPIESYPEILAFLDRLAMPFRWSNRFLFLDPYTADKTLTAYRRNWFQKRHGIMGLIQEAMNIGTQTFQNRDALSMATDADEAQGEASGGLVRYGYYTPVILLMDADPLIVDAQAREVTKQLQHHGFTARIETINAVEAYLGSLPGHGHPNVRRPVIHTLNLADLLPLTSIWPGLRQNPCPYYPPQSPALAYTATSGATPFRLNLHVSDVGHTLILGPTGSGKSTLVGLLVAQFFRYPDAQVFLFDKDYSLAVLTLAAGGAHYDIAGEYGATLAFAPLAQVDDPYERAWAEEWLAELLALQQVSLSPAQRKALHRGVELLGASPLRTFTHLANTLQDQVLRDGLHPYTLAGSLGFLLDADHDSLASGRFQNWEMSHLLSMGPQHLIPVLLYLFHRVEQRLDTHTPTLIVIEEAWMIALHSVFGDQVDRWLRTLRKKNAAVVFVTQSLADIEKSTRRDIVIESCQTKIFLPNPEAQSEQSRTLYYAFGLNDRQIELLTTAVPKRHYYYTSPLGRRLIDLALGPATLSFLGVQGREVVGEVMAYRQQYGAGWPAAWLRERGQDAWATVWEEAAQHTHPFVPVEEAAPQAGQRVSAILSGAAGHTPLGRLGGGPLG